MAVKELFIPEGRRKDVHRPLTGGVRRDAPPQALGPGEFRTLRDLYIDPGGLKRRHTAEKYAGGTAVDYPPITGIYSFWKLDGSQVTVILDKKFLYVVTASGLTGKYWKYDTGTVSVSGTTVTGSGTTWTGQNLQEGDIMVLDADGDGDGPESVEVESIDSNTQITLKSTPTGTYGAGTDYEIRRAFQHDTYDSYPIATPTPGKLYIADGARSLYSFDGSTFTTVGLSYYPACVELYEDRLWIAHTVESGNEYRYRIRWTDAGNGNWETFPTANYIDLPYFRGRIRRLFAMSDALVAYIDDAIFYGLSTQLPSLPVSFRQRGNRNQGVVGQMAMTSWSEGHFFVSQEDIYVITNREFKPIGTQVVRATIEECSDLSKVWAQTDYRNSRAVFGFPKDGDTMEEIWSFYWKTNSWASEKRSCSSISIESIVESITWDDLNAGGVLTTSTWSGGFTNYPTWSSLRGNESPRRLYFGRGGILEYFEGPGSADHDGVIPKIIMETGDIDYGLPDTVKCWTSLVLKLEKATTNDVSFTIEGSIKRGDTDTWKSLGTLVVSSGKDEGSINFRLTGDTGRFRVTSVVSEEVMITELNLSWKPLGREVQSRTS